MTELMPSPLSFILNLPGSGLLAYRRLLRGVLEELDRVPGARSVMIPFFSERIAEQIREGRFQALITEGGFPDGPPGLLGMLPMVGLRHPDPEGRLPRVVEDPAATARRAMTHFREEGLEQYGVFHNMNPRKPEGRRRSAAFLHLAVQEGLFVSAFPNGPRTEEKWSLDGQLADLADWLKDLPRPCGILCGDDEHAYRVMQAAEEAGLRIPADLAVLGHGNDDLLCDHVHPALSSIDPHFDVIGRESVRRLLEEIQGQPRKERITFLDCARVVRRESTDRRFHDYPIVQRAVLRIEQDLAAIPSAQTLADSLHVSHTTLSKQFRAATGQSTWNYIKQRRLDRALHLIRETDLTLSEICADIGLSTIAQLSTDIRKMTGKSPREWR
jgi:LacI family transcriptional regulator